MAPRWMFEKKKIIDKISLKKCPFPVKITCGTQKKGLYFYCYVDGKDRISGKKLTIRTPKRRIQKSIKQDRLIRKVYDDLKLLVTHELSETFQLKHGKRFTIPFDPHKKRKRK